MRLDLGDDDEPVINLVPMIDMLFLLLVFFLVATTFAQQEVQMRLDLPKSVAGKPAERQPPLVISVARDGTLVIEGRPVTADGLKQKLLAAAQRSKDQEILIRGDTQCQFGLVAQAFDACLAAELKRVSIAARPAQESMPK